jgi:predicted NAD-dependent protein-ADP-ribosyltransferase YbiA (DUF1768 family)
VKAILKSDRLVLLPESEPEIDVAVSWKPAHGRHVFFLEPTRGDVLVLRDLGPNDQQLVLLSKEPTAQEGHVFVLARVKDLGLTLRDLGHRTHACREPFLVVSSSRDPAAQLITNFAWTPFELDGRRYQSVEGFWQGLKFADEGERRRVAQLHGRRARQAIEYGATITYEGRAITVGTWEHWRLMHWACRAKFRQNAAAQAALLSTGDRPLVHRTRRDSKTIPGVIMADIWMRLRRKLRKEAAKVLPSPSLAVEPTSRQPCVLPAAEQVALVPSAALREELS